MKLPEDLLASLKNLEGFDLEAFVKVHSGAQVTSIRTNPLKAAMWNDKASITSRECSVIGNVLSFMTAAGRPVSGFVPEPALAGFSQVPWSRYGFYLQQRPSFTFDPLFHAGLYYVQEASSMFLEQAFLQLTDLSKPLKVLDLCAAPGGKSTHIQSLISPDSLLVSNEIIKNRNHALTDNILKWGAGNVIVTNNDPSSFQRTEGYFDVMVVDAPCSGSGLFRRDKEAMNEWSLNNVQLCCQRQKRILANAMPALKENGLLIYSTCSYSKEEDEDIAGWLMTEFGMEPCSLYIDDDWKIVETKEKSSVGYRFYPDKVKGEGFFLSCFRKQEQAKQSGTRVTRMEKTTMNEKTIIKPWLKEMDFVLLKEGNLFFVLPSSLVNDYAFLRSGLNIRYAGVRIGEIINNKLIPQHAFAQSLFVSAEIPSNELYIEDAISYLQRGTLNFKSYGKGWQLVHYLGQNLGWINVLPARINNYYPKEMRILKQSNDSAFEK